MTASYLAVTIDNWPCYVNRNLAPWRGILHDSEAAMGLSPREKEWSDKARRFLKVELKRANVSYKELVRRLHEHGIEETESSITSKMARGTFAVSFFLATLAVLELEGIRLEDL